MPVDFFNPYVIHNLEIIGNTNLQNDALTRLKMCRVSASKRRSTVVMPECKSIDCYCPLQILQGEWVQALGTVISGIVWEDKR